MRRRSTEKKRGIDMNLQKCACVRINDSKEIRRYLKKKKRERRRRGIEDTL